ncbi:MAG: DUF1772 domain-containing protein [Alphaproteobacteria bacterium]|nr:DUF1772 domain-containing protein [Alphaproteobacteria bacterium]
MVAPTEQRPGRAAGLRIAYFCAVLATGLALGPALAHLFALPNKIGLPRDEYFVTQLAYRGWNLLGIVAQVVTMTAAAILTRRDSHLLWPIIAAIACVVGAQLVFWIFTYPTNVATANWTVKPDNWEALRRNWEYSHATDRQT